MSELENRKINPRRLTSREVVEAIEALIELKIIQSKDQITCGELDQMEEIRRLLADTFKDYDNRGGVAVFGKNDLK